MSQKNRKILVVDDSKTSLALLDVQLKLMGLTTILTNNAYEVIETAIREQPDLILLDIMMPDIDGFEMCEQLKSDNRTSSIPIIFITAKKEVVDKIIGLNLGAIDYVTKPFDLGELRARIGVVLRIIELQEKNLSLANTDELTKLANRRRFFDIFEREILQSKITSRPLTLMMLDLDHFKSINDTYGHLVGDTILKKFAKILRDNLYPLDVAARYGGEEFIVLMPDTSFKKASKAGERLRGIVDRFDWKAYDNRISITISIGLVALEPNNIIDCRDMVKKADAALYAAKHKGRNCVVRWDQVNGDDRAVQPNTQDFYELQTKISSLTRQLRAQTMGTVSALEKAMSLVIKDPYLEHHAKHVQLYALAIAEEMNLSTELKEQIGTAALLHDVGKMGMPNYIFSKTASLTQEDRHIVKQHPAASSHILAPIGVFYHELQIIRHHHERFDGGGYPDGLKGREIEIGARVLTIADVFDAITSDHLYRNGRTYQAALEEIRDCSGTQFDPEIVKAFWKACEQHKSEWPLSNLDSLTNSMQQSLVTKP